MFVLSPQSEDDSGLMDVGAEMGYLLRTAQAYLHSGSYFPRGRMLLSLLLSGKCSLHPSTASFLETNIFQQRQLHAGRSGLDIPKGSVHQQVLFTAGHENIL